MVIDELSALLGSRGVPGELTAETSLTELGFRSIDFAALALRIEERAGRELDLLAGNLASRPSRVHDLQTFFRAALSK